jgi:hypothetical protein
VTSFRGQRPGEGRPRQVRPAQVGAWHRKIVPPELAANASLGNAPGRRAVHAQRKLSTIWRFADEYSSLRAPGLAPVSSSAPAAQPRHCADRSRTGVRPGLVVRIDEVRCPAPSHSVLVSSIAERLRDGTRWDCRLVIAGPDLVHVGSIQPDPRMGAESIALRASLDTARGQGLHLVSTPPSRGTGEQDKRRHGIPTRSFRLRHAPRKLGRGALGLDRNGSWQLRGRAGNTCPPEPSTRWSAMDRRAAQSPDHHREPTGLPGRWSDYGAQGEWPRLML